MIQIGAHDEDAATTLLCALRERGEHVGVLNLPEGGSVDAALRSLGARLDRRQHEPSLPV